MEHARTIEIAAPPATVWAVMSEIATWPEWTPSITRIEVLDAGPLREGLRARVGIKGAPGTPTWTVSAVNHGHDFTWGSNAPGMKTVATHVIEPAGAGSRVTLGIEQTGPGAMLLGPWLRKVSEKNIDLEINGLKRAAEARVPAAV